MPVGQAPDVTAPQITSLMSSDMCTRSRDALTVAAHRTAGPLRRLGYVLCRKIACIPIWDV